MPLRRADPRSLLPPQDRVKVNEIFYSIQGESTATGLPCTFVRLTGCQMRCVWCDSEYSFYEGRWMAREEVVEKVESFGCPLVEVTGGEPLLQPGCEPLLTELCDRGYTVMLETGGGVDITAVDSRVRRIVDIKCPASGESEHNLWSNLDALTRRDEVKFVLADRTDYEWACTCLRERALPEGCSVHFSPVHDTLPPEDLARWILEDRLAVRLQLQLHKSVWGATTRGV